MLHLRKRLLPPLRNSSRLPRRHVTELVTRLRLVATRSSTITSRCLLRTNLKNRLSSLLCIIGLRLVAVLLSISSLGLRVSVVVRSSPNCTLWSHLPSPPFVLRLKWCRQVEKSLVPYCVLHTLVRSCVIRVVAKSLQKKVLLNIMLTPV